ncbi:hypothetical protein [Candidatus Mesenet endosymbiont of Agriotes lineatus]|uniref:hypothetical protein n=1 Tax=Candidatus Mesenet endosymbiont of Agriotes lineatus TaxID=3077948 RepID=UPI0030D40C40
MRISSILTVVAIIGIFISETILSERSKIYFTSASIIVFTVAITALLNCSCILVYEKDVYAIRRNKENKEEPQTEVSSISTDENNRVQETSV